VGAAQGSEVLGQLLLSLGKGCRSLLLLLLLLCLGLRLRLRLRPLLIGVDSRRKNNCG